MSEVTIYHNPGCSKSRATLALLEREGIAPRIIHYLEDAPTPDQLRALLTQLGMSPRELMRRGEALYAELGLADINDEASLLEAMHRHPILIERPIVQVTRSGSDPRAAIGRPPEQVLAIL